MKVILITTQILLICSIGCHSNDGKVRKHPIPEYMSDTYQDSAIAFDPKNTLLMITYPDVDLHELYSTAQGEIVSLNTETNKLRRFTNDDYVDKYPSYNKRSNQIIFASKRPLNGYLTENGGYKLYLFDIARNSITRIDNNIFEGNIKDSIFSYTCPIWSPIANEIAFEVSLSEAEKLAIYNFDDPRSEIVCEIPNLFNMRWSPDGKYIAYNGFYVNDMQNEIGIVDVLKKKKEVISTENGFNILNWKRNQDELLVYKRNLQDSTSDISTYNVKTKALVPLTSVKYIEIEDLGRNDNEIIISKPDNQRKYDLWFYDIDLKIETRITSDGKMKENITFIR